jgi:hypothetical protein
MEKCMREVDRRNALSVSYAYDTCKERSCSCEEKLVNPSVSEDDGGLLKIVLMRNSYIAATYLCTQQDVTQVYCNNGSGAKMIQMIPGANAEELCLSIPPTYPDDCDTTDYSALDDSDSCISSGGDWVGVVGGVGACHPGTVDDGGLGGGDDLENFMGSGGGLGGIGAGIGVMTKKLDANGKVIETKMGELITKAEQSLAEQTATKSVIASEAAATRTALSTMTTVLKTAIGTLLDMQCTNTLTNYSGFPCMVTDKLVLGAVVHLEGAMVAYQAQIALLQQQQVALQTSIDLSVKQANMQLQQVSAGIASNTLAVNAANAQLTAINAQLGVMHAELQTLCTAPSPQNVKGCKIYAKELTDLDNNVKSIKEMLTINCIGDKCSPDTIVNLTAIKIQTAVETTATNIVANLGSAAATTLGASGLFDSIGINAVNVPVNAFYTQLQDMYILKMIPSSDGSCSLGSLQIFDRAVDIGPFFCPAFEYIRLIFGWILAFVTIYRCWSILLDGIVLEQHYELTKAYKGESLSDSNI